MRPSPTATVAHRIGTIAAVALVGCIDSDFEPADAHGVLHTDGGADEGGSGAEVSDSAASLADATAADDGAVEARADVQSETCPTGAGCPCSSDDGCASGLCTVTPTGKRCAAFCVEGQCKPGYLCGAATIQGADGKPKTKFGVCLHRWASECIPCNVDAVCPVPADPKAACVDPLGEGGAGGRACAPSCSQDADCPPNRVCKQRAAVSGVTAGHCVPPDGVCTCSPWSVELAAASSCTVTAPGMGMCEGIRVCTAQGLQPCSAPVPLAEACNGADDDCDGAIDEPAGATPVCDDANPCTADACGGKAGCAHTPQDGACSDDDGCTGPDACGGGQCKGPALSCDDGNPCTADSCIKADGCQHAAQTGACDDGDACAVLETCQDGACKAKGALACGDDNPCTNDLCEPTSGCVHLPEQATCSDGNACTGVDACKMGACTGPALFCDDGWGCTADACAPNNGCTFKPAGAGCGQAKVPYQVAFGCADPAFAPWKVSAPGIALASPTPPPLAWKVDDTPALGGTPQCALNVNNGADLACGFGQSAVAQTADSPWLDATALAAGAPLFVRFESAGEWSSTLSARLLVKGESGTWAELAKLPASAAVWGKVNLPISAWAGKNFQLRFELSSPDCSAPAGTGWFVRNLEVVVDPCATNNGGCAAVAVCSPAGSSASCACPKGYSGDGKTCLDIDECKNGTAKCGAGATCTNTAGSFSCGCPSGFSGDGTTCTDIDECATGAATCAAVAACSNTTGSYTCKCPAGYSGDGKTCKDIDECATGTSGCASAATCTNIPGGVSCACKPGWTGNGKACTDVDECQSVALSGCPTQATCTNTVGSYSCACKPGWLGDGKTCLLYGGPDAPASSCKAILGNNPTAPSGTYWLVLAGGLVQVSCDMTTDGGGWTIVAYKADLPFGSWPKITGAWLWLPSDFATVLSAAQIKALQEISTEGRQTYVGLCNRMVHYYYTGAASYAAAFGFRFLDGTETSFGVQSYAPHTITVPQDGCKAYGQEGGTLATSTQFVIHSKKVPVINVKYKTIINYSATKFGSPLLKYPAMLR